MCDRHYRSGSGVCNVQSMLQTAGMVCNQCLTKTPDTRAKQLMRRRRSDGLEKIFFEAESVATFRYRWLNSARRGRPLLYGEDEIVLAVGFPKLGLYEVDLAEQSALLINRTTDAERGQAKPRLAQWPGRVYLSDAPSNQHLRHEGTSRSRCIEARGICRCPTNRQSDRYNLFLGTDRLANKMRRRQTPSTTAKCRLWVGGNPSISLLYKVVLAANFCAENPLLSMRIHCQPNCL